MRAVVLVLFILAGCSASVTNQKMDAISAKLDAIERKHYQNTVDVEKDIDAVQADLADFAVPH